MQVRWKSKWRRVHAPRLSPSKAPEEFEWSEVDDDDDDMVNDPDWESDDGLDGEEAVIHEQPEKPVLNHLSPW